MANGWIEHVSSPRLSPDLTLQSSWLMRGSSAPAQNVSHACLWSSIVIHSDSDLIKILYSQRARHLCLKLFGVPSLRHILTFACRESISAILSRVWDLFSHLPCVSIWYVLSNFFKGLEGENNPIFRNWSVSVTSIYCLWSEQSIPLLVELEVTINWSPIARET